VNVLSKLRFEIARAWRTFKRAGTGGVYRGVKNAAAGVVFDLYHGVDTAALWTRYSLPEGYEGAFEYGPAKISDLKRVLSNLQTLRHEEFVFVDVGSGKGRTMLMASRLPFKKVIGIELSAELHEIALHNIRKFRDLAQKCKNVVNHCCDATVFPLPPENIVLFLYNPFKAPVMARFLAHLEESLLNNPREVYIVYVKPLCHDLMMNTGWLKLLSMADSLAMYQYIAKRAAAGQFPDS
jgi:hypothetical protein